MPLSLSPHDSLNQVISQPINRFPEIFISLKGKLPPELANTEVVRAIHYRKLTLT